MRIKTKYCWTLIIIAAIALAFFMYRFFGFKLRRAFALFPKRENLYFGRAKP